MLTGTGAVETLMCQSLVGMALTSGPEGFGQKTGHLFLWQAWR